jgi:hypothetical protein
MQSTSIDWGQGLLGAHGILIQIMKPTPTYRYMLLCFIYRICIVIDSIERDIETTDVATQTKHQDILPIQICWLLVCLWLISCGRRELRSSARLGRPLKNQIGKCIWNVHMVSLGRCTARRPCSWLAPLFLLPCVPWCPTHWPLSVNDWRNSTKYMGRSVNNKVDSLSGQIFVSILWLAAPFICFFIYEILFFGTRWR